MISGDDLNRIKNDAYIAADALSAIAYSGDQLHEGYLQEKAETAQRCLNFLKVFYQKEQKA